jgi:hypothetical protein
MRHATRWSLLTATLVTVLAACSESATTNETAPATPVEIGEAFMTALDAHDVDAMVALAESEEVLASEEGSFEWFRSEIEQEGVLGWTYDYECEETNPTTVTCQYAFSNHISEAFDLGPYAGSSVILRINDGRITSFTNDEATKEWHEGGALDLFYEWMVTTYPDEVRVENFYYHYSDEANLDFIKEYIPLLLASG